MDVLITYSVDGEFTSPGIMITLDPARCSGSRSVSCLDIVLNTIAQCFNQKPNPISTIPGRLSWIATEGIHWPGVIIPGGALTSTFITTDELPRHASQTATRVDIYPSHWTLTIHNRGSRTVLARNDIPPAPLDCGPDAEDIFETLGDRAPLNTCLGSIDAPFPSPKGRFILGTLLGALQPDPDMTIPYEKSFSVVRILGWMSAWAATWRDDVHLDPFTGRDGASHIHAALFKYGMLASDRPWCARTYTYRSDFKTLELAADADAIVKGRQMAPVTQSLLQAADPVLDFLVKLLLADKGELKKAAPDLSAHRRLQAHDLAQRLFATLGIDRAPVPGLDENT